MKNIWIEEFKNGFIALKSNWLLFDPFQGEYFNDEEVRRMLAAEAAEEKLKREEELIREEEMAKEANQEEGKRKKRGIIIAP